MVDLRRGLLVCPRPTSLLEQDLARLAKIEVMHIVTDHLDPGVIALASVCELLAAELSATIR